VGPQYVEGSDGSAAGGDRSVNIVVVGCGRVGSGLAAVLSGRGDHVAVIDRTASAFARLPAGFPGRTVVGVGFDREVLREAGVEDADGVAAVTSGDNSNIVVARVARETFGVAHVVARIYDPRRAQIYQRLGIATVATSQWTVEQVLRRISPVGHSVEWTDPTAAVALVERVIAPELAGRAVADLGLDDLGRILAVTRFGATALAAPDLVLQDGDVLYLAALSARLVELDERLTPAPGGVR
jgi:trk/ktr system potassium uptake protein